MKKAEIERKVVFDSDQLKFTYSTRELVRLLTLGAFPALVRVVGTAKYKWQRSLLDFVSSSHFFFV